MARTITARAPGTRSPPIPAPDSTEQVESWSGTALLGSGGNSDRWNEETAHGWRASRANVVWVGRFCGQLSRSGSAGTGQGTGHHTGRRLDNDFRWSGARAERKERADRDEDTPGRGGRARGSLASVNHITSLQDKSNHTPGWRRIALTREALIKHSIDSGIAYECGLIIGGCCIRHLSPDKVGFSS